MAHPLGTLAYHLAKKRVHIARTNIKICYPNLSTEQQEQRVQQSLIETARWFCEAGAVWLWSKERLLSLTTIHHASLITDALAKERGVVVIVPHLGNWELLFPVLTQYGHLACFYKEDSDYTQLYNLINQQRTKHGATLAPDDANGVRTILKNLKNKNISAILPDHKPRSRSGVFAPFFSHPALTTTLVHSLAMHTQAEVLSMAIVRNATGFEVTFDRVDHQLQSDPVLAAAALNQAIEKCIALAPEQFQWVYSRFSKQPDQQRSPYK